MYQIFEYLYSVIVIAIRNILAKVIKFCRKIKLIKVLKIFSTIIFINQTKQLTINYMEYETVIDLKLIGDYDSESSPAISLCLKSSRFYLAHNDSSLILDRIGKINCHVSNGRKNLEYSSEINRFFFE
jgi:hypothetical protein